MLTCASAQPPAKPPVPTHQNTKDIAARLLPLPKEDREKVLKRFPGGNATASQLVHMFDGTWYVHHGDLTIDGDFESNLNLVVDGDLTVRGTLSDASGEASLVVTGDVRAVNVLTSQLMVVLGSLDCSGLVHGDYNDYCLEVYGKEMRARALVLTDHSASLPDALKVEFEYNSNSSSGKGRAEDLFVDELVRWQDDDYNTYKRVSEGGKVTWIDDGGTELSAEEAKELKITSSLPALFEDVVAVCQEGRSFFKEPTREPLHWQLDRNAAPEVVSQHAASKNVKERVAAAAHPQLSAELVERLAADPEPAVRMAVVHRAELAPELATKLAGDKEADVRRQLAASPHATAHLGALVGDVSPQVRRASASHKDLNDAQRRKLLADAEKPVRTRALRYLPVTAAWVAELRSAEDEALAAWAIQHQDEVQEASATTAASSDDWKKDLLDARTAVREAALKKGRSVEMLAFLDENRDRFVKDDSAKIRSTLSSATRDAKTLETLSKDKGTYVRRFALDNLSVPEALLVEEANRLAKAPASSWDMLDPGYVDHASDLQSLLRHPRLPAEAIRIIHRVYPRLWRMEPHRNMPLDVVLERALTDSASLEFDPSFREWTRIAQDPNGDHGKAFAAMLAGEESYLLSAARLNRATPPAALLAHAKTIADDKYSLEEVAQSPRLGDNTPAAVELLKWLAALENGSVDNDLVANPDLPLTALKELASRSPEQAAITLWQVHGVAVQAGATP